MNIQYKYVSSLGTIYLTASDKGLTGIYWKKQGLPAGENKFIITAVKEINEYLNGERTKFSVPLDFAGTPFQMKVWKELLKIPFGKTLSYKEVAFKIKNEKAIRAVGAANGRNPLCIIIPCHRVIASDGTLGGYAGGLPVKEKLLKLERHQ